MANEDRFFFHSFPRKRKQSDDINAKGLSILDSMCRHGLLLVPELVSWTDPSATQDSQKIDARQRRICFTELSPSQLRAHSEVFGSFALGFRIDDLRALGALPVFYVPNVDSRQPSLAQTGVTLLARLADAYHVLERIVATRAILQGRTIVLTLTKQNGEKYERYFDEKDSNAIRDYLTLLEGAPGHPMSEIIGALQSMSSMFYPTENLKHNNLLDYYRMREWRLISDIRLKGAPVTVDATEEQRKELLAIDSDFYSSKLTYEGVVATRAEKCHFMRLADGREVMSIVDRIICPPEVQPTVTDILARNGLRVPVSTLEDLGH